MNYLNILEFWFKADTQALWFAKSVDFDALISEKFSDIHQQAAQAELWSWRKSAEGRLAEIIILDQFSRNLFRDQAAAFAQDPMALILAQEAISLDLDKQLSPEQRAFLYMPFMHSESRRIHEVALTLFERLNDPTVLDYGL